MDQSLSIVLPVHNAEETLAEQVCHLLDILPELTRDFEVLIIDDGSTDHTEEVAAHLAIEFPQVRSARHRCRKGISAAVQTGLERTTGDIVFVQDNHTPLSPGDLRRLWDMRGDDELVMARAQPHPRPLDSGLIGRLMAWGKALKTPPSAAGEIPRGIQMIRRRAIQELRECDQPERQLALASAARTDKLTRGHAPKQAPNFLTRVQEFAAGE